MYWLFGCPLRVAYPGGGACGILIAATTLIKKMADFKMVAMFWKHPSPYSCFNEVLRYFTFLSISEIKGVLGLFKFKIQFKSLRTSYFDS